MRAYVYVCVCVHAGVCAVNNTYIAEFSRVEDLQFQTPPDKYEGFHENQAIYTTVRMIYLQAVSRKRMSPNNQTPTFKNVLVNFVSESSQG